MPEAKYHLFHDKGLIEPNNGFPGYAKHSYGAHTKIVCPSWPEDRAGELLRSRAPGSIPGGIFGFHSRGPDITKDSNDLWVDATVATAGIQLGWKLGAFCICLLGTDAFRYAGGKYFWDDFDDTKEIEDPYMALFHRDMERLAEELLKLYQQWVPPILNCSPKSRIKVWPKVDVELILRGKRHERVLRQIARQSIGERNKRLYHYGLWDKFNERQSEGFGGETDDRDKLLDWLFSRNDPPLGGLGAVGEVPASESGGDEVGGDETGGGRPPIGESSLPF